MLAFCFFVGISTYAQTDEQLKQKIESINKELSKAMIAGDNATVLKYYASDAISLPNNSKLIEGLDAIKKSNESMMQSGAKIKTFESATKQVKSCGNTITEIGTYKMSMTIPGMSSDYEDEGKYLTIWEKQSDGSLKIKTEIWNTDKQPMGGGM